MLPSGPRPPQYLELNLDAVGRVEQDLGRTVTPPSPPMNWWRTVRLEVQDRANLLRARGVE
jgi:hypothetical protein